MNTDNSFTTSTNSSNSSNRSNNTYSSKASGRLITGRPLIGRNGTLIQTNGSGLLLPPTPTGPPRPPKLVATTIESIISPMTPHKSSQTAEVIATIDITSNIHSKASMPQRNTICASAVQRKCIVGKGILHASVYHRCGHCDERLHGATCAYHHNDGRDFVCWKDTCIIEHKKNSKEEFKRNRKRKWKRNKK